jgi:hypothetical protein
MTAAQAKMTELTRKIGVCVHELDTPAPSDLFYDVTKKKNKCGVTVRLNMKAVPQDQGLKKMALKWGDIRERTRGDICILMNINGAPAEVNSVVNKGML